MKNIIKFILSFICYVALIPLLLALTVCLTWYLLPEFQATFMGEWISSQLPDQTMLIATGMIVGSILLFFILSRLFKVIKSSKANNLYTHFASWIIAFALAIESLATFFIAEELSTAAFDLNLTRKIGIIAGGVGMLLYSILNPKIRTLVDRRIQAYDTAKELNANGRSSVVGTQVLKALDFCFPELLLMLVLCFAFNIQISVYFIYIIASFAIPVVGNMICDSRVKKEAIRKE